jgi:hypothetical protein
VPEDDLAEIVRMSLRRVLARFLAPYGYAGSSIALTVTPRRADDAQIAGRAPLRMIIALLVVLVAGMLVGNAELFLLYRSSLGALNSSEELPGARQTPVTETERLVLRQNPREVAASSLLSNQQLYLRAIAHAAVKSPQEQVKLIAIPESQTGVTFVTLKSKTSHPIQNGPLGRPTWVSLPSQLQSFCRGKADPLLAIQQVLGLPPYPNETEKQDATLFQFTVDDRKQVFRPCVSSRDITSDHCDFEPNVGDAEASGFLLKQIWQSYRIGFKDFGYPFTGLGWSYNWDPASVDHVGVSEYVVRQGAEASDVKALSPADFCRAQ